MPMMNVCTYVWYGMYKLNCMYKLNVAQIFLLTWSAVLINADPCLSSDNTNLPLKLLSAMHVARKINSTALCHIKATNRILTISCVPNAEAQFRSVCPTSSIKFTSNAVRQNKKLSH